METFEIKTVTQKESKDDLRLKKIKLYIDFAEAVQKKTGESLADTLYKFTPLQWEFQRYSPDPDLAVWNEFVTGIGKKPLLDWVLEFSKRRDDPKLAKNSDKKGKENTPKRCFMYDVFGEDVDIHFDNNDKSGFGPLSKERMKERRAELKELFTIIKFKHPKAKEVHGRSWLYNLESYKRLFPESYAKSVKPYKGKFANGNGLWGQLSDREGNLKQDLVTELFENLEKVDANDIPSAFKYQRMTASAPIEDFYKEYGVE